jgi:hypothetical protein
VEKRIMTASTPIVRYYDHLRFVYEVESTVRELRRNTENQPQAPATTPGGQTPQQPGGESHQKDGGSRLNQRGNPNEAPQQTVNPPQPLWGSELLQARLELTPRRRRRSLVATFTSQAPSTQPDASGPNRFSPIDKGVLAKPERSTSCLA